MGKKSERPAEVEFLTALAEGLVEQPLAHADYENDPVGFASDILNLAMDFKKQQIMIEAINQHRYVIVESGHGVGKSMGAAILVCWWMSTKRNPKALTIAPTWSQVNNILWPYIRKLGRSASLPGEIMDTPRWKMGDSDEDSLAVGLSPKRATEVDVASMQGYHSPNLLVIMDEAPGLPRILWDAVKNLAVGENNRILAVGNPIAQSGPFFEATQNPGWYHINMSCLEHPNVLKNKEIVPGAVSKQWVNEMVRDHTMIVEPGTAGAIEWPRRSGIWRSPDPIFQSRVLGVAPDEAEDQLVAMAWIATAMAWEADAIEDPVLGFDPARFGGDEAAMCCRRGAKVLWVKTRRPATPDPSGEQAGWLKEEMNQIGAIRCYVEETGLGAGVVDKARSIGLPVVAINFANRARQSRRFMNLRAELGWIVREKLQAAWLTLPQDERLMADLAAPKFWFANDGRIVIEPKLDIRKRLGRSPNLSDALWLSFVGLRAETRKYDVQALQEELTLVGTPWAIARPAGVYYSGRKSRWKR